MAAHYTQGRRDALGRPISDELWDQWEAERAESRARNQAAETARAASQPAPLGWGEFAEGLAGSAGRGATLGFSDYLNDDLKNTTSRFADQYPITAGLANLLGAVGGMATGTAEEGLAARGLQLAGRAAESVSPSIARVAANVLPRLSLSNLPVVGRLASSVVNPAAQGAIYAYNTSSNDDPNPVGRAIQGAIGGAILGPLANAGASGISRLANVAQANASRAIRKTLDATGLDAPTLSTKLAQLSGNARTYDVDPTALGSGGILSNLGRVYPKFTPTIRNTAAKDIKDIGAASQGLTKQYLGDTLPSTYTDFETQLDNARTKVTAPLYDAANQTNVDLSRHPYLMHNFVLGDNFSQYLTNKLGDVVGDRPLTRNIQNFLNNRESALNAGAQAENVGIRKYLPDDMLNDIYHGAINRHITANNLDLSLPRPLVRGYLDELQETIPPEQASKNIQQTFQSLEPDSPNSVERFINNSKQAIQAVNPADAAAQAEYARMSEPLNQVDWARNLTREGTQTKLGSEVTDDYISRNNHIRNALADSALKDNSRPLTRYVLDEKVLDASKGEPGLTPSAILNTVDPMVRPRLESVFGQEPVNNLIRDAKINNQLISNRTGLSRIGYPDDGSTGKMIYSSPTKYVLDKGIGIYKNLIDSKKDKVLMDFLQQNPSESIAHITNYLQRFPNGTQEGFRKYINSAVGNLSGQAIAPTFVDPQTIPHWDTDGSRYWNGGRWTYGNEAVEWSKTQKAQNAR